MNVDLEALIRKVYQTIKAEQDKFGENKPASALSTPSGITVAQ